MIKKAVLMCFFSLMLIVTKAQLYQIDNRTIYSGAIKGLQKQDKNTSFMSGFNYSLKTLKSFNFSHPNYSYIDTNKLKLSSLWLSFLKSVDTAKISEKISQTQKKKINEKLAKMFKKNNSFSLISSAIISNDYHKAVVSYDYFKAKQNMAGGVVLLERRGNKWFVVEVIRLYIS